MHFAKIFPKILKIFLGHFQDQSSGSFQERDVLGKLAKIHRRSSAPESLFNKIAVVQSFLSKNEALKRHVNFAKFSRTYFTITEHFRATAWFFTI